MRGAARKGENVENTEMMEMVVMSTEELFAMVDQEQREAVRKVEKMRRKALKYLHLNKILAVFGTWAVTTYGLECLKQNYAVEKERLWEQDWIYHMLGKDWCNMRDFCEALYEGQEIHSKVKPKYLEVN